MQAVNPDIDSWFPPVPNGGTDQMESRMDGLTRESKISFERLRIAKAPQVIPAGPAQLSFPGLDRSSRTWPIATNTNWKSWTAAAASTGHPAGMARTQSLRMAMVRC